MVTITVPHPEHIERVRKEIINILGREFHHLPDPSPVVVGLLSKLLTCSILARADLEPEEPRALVLGADLSNRFINIAAEFLSQHAADFDGC